MAHDKAKIFTKAKTVIKKNNLVFIEDVVSFLPIAKKTFYEFYPIGSDESNTLKDLLDDNKINMKVSMRKKWMDSDAPALQTALYKLICDDSERKKLSMQYQETELKGGIKTESRFSLEAIPEDLLFDIADRLQEDENLRELEAKTKSEE